MDRLTSRSMLAGGAIAAALTAASIVGAVLQLWWLAVGSGMALLSGIFLLTIDTARRVRYLPSRIKQIVRKTTPPRKVLKQPPPPPPRAAEQDLLGAVRVLQAQYLGRLDRLQTEVEHALRELRDVNDSTGRTVEQDDGA